MKKNSSYKYAIVYSTVALALASCNSGKNNQAWQDVKAPNSDQKVLIDNICGNDGVTNLSINEAGGEPINPSLQLGNSKGLRAYVNCVNGTNFDVTDELHINSNSRHFMLDMILSYYSLHLPGFKKPRSLAILKELFREK